MKGRNIDNEHLENPLKSLYEGWNNAEDQKSFQKLVDDALNFCDPERGTIKPQQQTPLLSEQELAEQLPFS